MIDTGIARAGLDHSESMMEMTEETRKALQQMREDMTNEVLKGFLSCDIQCDPLRHCAHSADPEVHGAQNV